MQNQSLLHLKSTNTPKSITTHTNHSPQRAVTQLQLSHQLFVTSAEDELGDTDRKGRRGREKMVYWNLFGERNNNVTGTQWTVVPPRRHFYQDTKIGLSSPNIPHCVSLFKYSLVETSMWD